MYQRHHLHRNVNRLIDTKEINKISGKPLKTKDSGTLDVAGIPCLLLELCQGSMGSGGCERPQWSRFYPPPPLVQCAPSIYDWRTDLDTLEKKQFFEYNEIVAGARM